MCNKTDDRIAVDRPAVIRAVREVLMEEFACGLPDGARLLPPEAERLGDYVLGLLERAEEPDGGTSQSVQESGSGNYHAGVGSGGPACVAGI